MLQQCEVNKLVFLDESGVNTDLSGPLEGSGQQIRYLEYTCQYDNPVICKA